MRLPDVRYGSSATFLKARESSLSKTRKGLGFLAPFSLHRAGNWEKMDGRAGKSLFLENWLPTDAILGIMGKFPPS